MSSIVTFNIQSDPIVIYEGDIDLNDTLVITSSINNCNVYLRRNNTPSTSSFIDRPINIVYSLDEGETWIELNLESQNSSYTVNLGTLNSGKSIYIRGNNFGRSTLYGLNICTSSVAYVSGNIMSLFFRKNPRNEFPQYNTYGAFQGIFSGSKINNASQLSLPTTLEDYCYAYMFENCTWLKSVPTLSATTLEEYCYQGMFKGCSGLITVPELPATSLAEGCYKGMFEGCTVLKTAPELPVTTLKEYCYQGMFKGCTRLTTAPELPAATLVNGCYANMFENCTSLNYIHIYSDMQIGVPYTTNWVKNVAPTGTFIGTDDIYHEETGDHGVPIGWRYVCRYEFQYFTIEFLNGSHQARLEVNSNAPTISLSYSTNEGGTWTSCVIQNGSINLPTANKVLLKGNNTTLARILNDDRYNIYGVHVNCLSNKYKVYGNIMSLLNENDFRTNSEFASGSSYNFAELFGSDNRDDDLTDAGNLILPATTLRPSCYENMFTYCASLTTAPELPATKVASYCYQEMFEQCYSLTKAPSILPATSLAYMCYDSMFSDCFSLTTAPELPATSLAHRCYYKMFSSCIRLTAAPEIPATSLASTCCTDMFFGCASLTKAPSILPATTLAMYCYQGMFRYCTSLETAPELPATTLDAHCYEWMFEGCTKLNYVKCLATDIEIYGSVSSWLSGVAASGTFVKAASMNNWTTGASGIPNGWTVQNA